MAAHTKPKRTTRLSNIHPYPAMIADEYALRIAKEHIQHGSLVLDPLCGTGRTLYAASAVGGICYGLDINPLAALIAQAKNVKCLPDMPTSKQILTKYSAKQFDIQPGRRVKWFSRSAVYEISAIVSWINSLSTDRSTLIALACILSATVREVCFCRKKQWKLHRMSAQARQAHNPSALKVFRRRLANVAAAARKHKASGLVRVQVGNANELCDTLKKYHFPSAYDVIFTSPPYGDSKSTVNYGGISSVCLGVLQYIDKLGLSFRTGHQIDTDCLGGKGCDFLAIEAMKYWKGSATSLEQRKINNFLEELAVTCKQISKVSHENTKVIFVVSRRCVRRRRLYLDQFLKDQLAQYGFRLSDSSRRYIKRKNTPYLIDRKARSKTPDKVKTMDYEFLMVFEK